MAQSAFSEPPKHSDKRRGVSDGVTNSVVSMLAQLNLNLRPEFLNHNLEFALSYKTNYLLIRIKLFFGLML